MAGGLQLERDGAELHPAVLDDHDLARLRALADQCDEGSAGVRLFGEPALQTLLSAEGAVGGLAARRLGSAARPVRAVLFDKSAACNWAVAWHQDRVIAVRDRVEVEGFGPWSTKAGVLHVMPPFALLAEMLTLRLHLDRCDADNAALWIAVGSHRLGRVAAGEAAATAAGLPRLCCTADAGDVWAYATPILHASERAAVPRRRRVIQVDYAAADLPGRLEWAGV